MSPLTREASSEARQYGEPGSVPCPIVKSATSASSADAAPKCCRPPMVFSGIS